jgi:hypothetical protein
MGFKEVGCRLNSCGSWQGRMTRCCKHVRIVWGIIEYIIGVKGKADSIIGPLKHPDTEVLDSNCTHAIEVCPCFCANSCDGPSNESCRMCNWFKWNRNFHTDSLNWWKGWLLKDMPGI